MMRIALVVTIAAVMAGCVTRGAERSAAERLVDEERWLTTEVRGIRLYANVSPERVQHAASQVFQFFELVERITGSRELRLDRPVDGFVFARDDQWRHFSGNEVGHAYDSFGRYRLGWSAEFTAHHVLLHELVHVILYADPGPRYPSWYHEGLAEFLGGALIRDDVAILGSIPESRRPILAAEEALPLDEIISGRGLRRGDTILRFYADAFAFVHFGVLGGDTSNRFAYVSDLADLVRRIRWGEPAESALPAAFSLDRGTIEARYREHRSSLLRAPVARRGVVRFARDVPEFELRPARGDEIASVLASYGALGGAHPEFVDALWLRVLEDRPGDSEAHLGRARALAALGRVEAATAELDAAKPDPHDRGAYALAAGDVACADHRRLARDGRAREAREALLRARSSYAAALRSQPDDPMLLLAYGRTFVWDDQQKDLADGLLALERASRMRPHVTSILLALAALQIRAGDGDSARRHLVFVLSEETSPETERRAREILEKLDRSGP